MQPPAAPAKNGVQHPAARPTAPAQGSHAPGTQLARPRRTARTPPAHSSHAPGASPAYDSHAPCARRAWRRTWRTVPRWPRRALRSFCETRRQVLKFEPRILEPGWAAKGRARTWASGTGSSTLPGRACRASGARGPLLALQLAQRRPQHIDFGRAGLHLPRPLSCGSSRALGHAAQPPRTLDRIEESASWSADNSPSSFPMVFALDERLPMILISSSGEIESRPVTALSSSEYRATTATG